MTPDEMHGIRQRALSRKVCPDCSSTFDPLHIGTPGRFCSGRARGRDCDRCPTLILRVVAGTVVPSHCGGQVGHSYPHHWDHHTAERGQSLVIGSQEEST